MLIFFISLVPRIINLDEPGLTWDEPAYIYAGRTYINGILKSRIFDTSVWEANWEHPPIAKYLIGLSLNILEPLGLSEVAAARLPNTILGSLTCVLLYLFLSGIYEESVSILASLILSYIPNFFAHTRYAALDAPVTFFIVFSMYAFQKWIKTRELRWIFISAALCGLALGVKISAILLPFILSVWFLLIHWHRAQKIKILFKSLVFAISFSLLALISFFLSWPLLWIDPRFVIKYFNFHVYHFNIPVYYLGKVYQRAPWHYPFIILFITTPVGISLAAIFGVLFALKNALKCRKIDFSILIITWLILTLLRVSISYGYDGVRLFLDALPPFSSLAAIGIIKLSTLSRKLPNFLGGFKRIIPYLLTTLLIIFEIYACVITHPYETSYYNELVMAFDGTKLFEKTYWGEVYKEVIEWLEDKSPGANVIVPIAPHLAQYYAKTLKVTHSISNIILREGPIYFAFQAREGFYFDPLIDFCLNNLKPVHTIQVNGIIIAYIFNLTSIALQ